MNVSKSPNLIYSKCWNRIKLRTWQLLRRQANSKRSHLSVLLKGIFSLVNLFVLSIWKVWGSRHENRVTVCFQLLSRNQRLFPYTRKRSNALIMVMNNKIMKTRWIIRWTKEFLSFVWCLLYFFLFLYPLQEGVFRIT